MDIALRPFYRRKYKNTIDAESCMAVGPILLVGFFGHS